MVNYIGPYQGCGAPDAPSGIYLNQLPGIEFAQFQDLANADQITWNGAWSDLQKTAAVNFKEDVITEFGKRYQLKQLLQSIDLEKGINTSNLTAPVGGTKNGILIETFQAGNQCIGSNMLQLYVQAVNFYYSGSAGSKTFTIYFIDADLLTVEYSLAVTGAAAGWNQSWIDRGFSARRLYVVVDGNFDNYVQQDISLFNVGNFGSGNNYGWGWGAGNYLYYNWNSCGLQSRIQGVQFTQGTNTAVTSTNIFGVSAVFSTQCTWDSLVCANKRHFSSAWQYRLGIDFMDLRINSSRINRWTTVDKSGAEKLMKHYSTKYYGSVLKERWGEELHDNRPVMGKLQNAIESIVLNDNDGCLKMNNYAIWRETKL